MLKYLQDRLAQEFSNLVRYASIAMRNTDDNDSTIILANGFTIDELNKEKVRP